jgi:signal transduction histidine kinase/CheY-like chemotaxis protein
MLGFDSVEELQQAANASQFYPDPAERTALLAVLVEKGCLRNHEVHLVRRDGTRITVLENSRVVLDDEGRPQFYQGTLTDITELKQAERALREARDRALESSRLKSHFLANMSHELRTPMNAVIGMSGLLADTPLGREQREYVETILHSAQFLLELLSQVLDFSRIESGRLDLDISVFRLRDVVEEAVSMLGGRAAAKDLELVSSVEPGVPELVVGDPARLRQVLTNLVGNAVKFTDEGEVEVHVSRDGAHPGLLRFEVRDTGIGVPEEALSYIFEPFRQADGSAKRRHGGTGLGLAIASQIVERFGGRIGCTSTRGAGSLFWFTAGLAPAPGWRATHGGPYAALAGTRCFLDCRNAALRRVLRQWLVSWGVKVEESAPVLPLEDRRAFLLCDRERLDALQPDDWTTVVSLGPAPSAVPPGVRCIPVSKPVRELSLLEALLRTFGPPPPDSASQLAPLAARLAPEARRARILAAEDNRINQLVIAKFMERLGHDVDLVANGREVLEAVRERRYDLILMDCQMPEMDGFEATAALRALGAPLAHIPIVAVTAHAVHGDRELCLAAGMDDYLSKPVALDDLAAVLDRWLEHSSGVPRSPASSYPSIE